MTKTAFITLDAESFCETSCVKELNPELSGCPDCLDEIDEFLAFFDSENIKTTIFITEETLNKKKSTLLNAIKNGHEIGVHAEKHVSPQTLEKEELFRQLSGMRERIKSELGYNAVSYRAPCFGINNDVLGVIKRCGFKRDSSALNYENAARSGNLNLSDFEKINSVVYKSGDFYEFKPSVGDFMNMKMPLSGGGYLRLSPWNIVKKSLEKYVENENAYLFYVHPFEIYKGKFPKIKGLKFGDKIFINRGRKKYFYKIKELVAALKNRGYEFKTIGGF